MARSHDTCWRREFLLWLLLLALWRSLSILALADVSFWGEELEKGAAAKAMLDGLSLPHFKLAYHYYEGGGFAISHLKALFFLLVGENLLAQRLGGLLSCLLVFAAYWRLLDHHFGRRAARIGALLFLLGPESFQRYSLLSLGIHFEAMAFGLFVLDEGLRLLLDDPSARTPRGDILLGVVAGLGLFFSYQNALVIGFAGLGVLLLRRRWLLGSGGMLALGGFLLGLGPLFYMASRVGGALLDIHGEKLVAVGGLDRVEAFFTATYGGLGPWGWVSRLGYPLAALVALTLGWRSLRDRRRGAFMGLAAFALFWSIVWASSPFVDTDLVSWFSWLRLAPLTLVLMVLASAGLAGRWGWGARVLLGAVSLLGLSNTAVILSGGRPTHPLANWDLLIHTKGYDYRGYLPMLLGHLDSRDMEEVAPLLAYDEPDPEFLQYSFAIAFFENRRRAIDLATQIDTLEKLMPGGERGYLLGLGPSLLIKKGGDTRAALEYLAQLGTSRAERLAEGLGFFPGYRFEPREQLLADLSAYGRGPMGEAYTRGLGMRAYRNLVMSTLGGEQPLHEERIRAFLADQDEDLAPLLLQGFEEERERWKLY